MSDYPVSDNEDQRLCRLEELSVLDTQAEPVLDAFTRLATAVTGLPLSLLNLVDRERVFLKSAKGVGAQGMSIPRGEAFCAWTIASDGIMEIEDTRLDARFAHLHAVTGPLQAVHYVGAPLVFPGGERVGTICLIGHQPGRLQVHERKFLLGLADSIVEVLLLRERESQLKQEQLLSHAHSMAELSPVGLFAMDAQGRVKHANAGWRRLWGFDSSAPVPSLDWLSRVLAADRPRVLEGWQKALASGQAWSDSFQVATVTDKPCWLSMRMAPVAGMGSESAFVGAVADISHMKELAMELAQAHAILKTVLENLPCGLAVYDKDLRHVLSNPQLLKMQQLPEDLFSQPGAGLRDILRRRANLDRLGNEDTEAVVDRRIAEMKARESLTEEVLQSNGDAHELRTRIMPNGWQVQVLTDISHARQTAQALEASQAQLSVALAEARTANKAKSDFLATMSHELRTPLNAILGFAQVLEDSLPDPEQSTQARHIRQTGETLTRILNDVLDVAKIEAGKLELDPQPFEMAQVMHNCVSIFQIMAETKGLRFDHSLHKDLPLLVGDPVRLQQILHNLLSNAFKFTTAGTVRLYLALDGQDQGEDGRGRAHIRMEVHDTGVGLTPEQLGRIFQRFEQAAPSTAGRYGGTGLGLAIVQSLVHKMGGTVEVQSSFGQGSRFVLRIPFGLADAAVAQAAQLQAQAAEAPLDILVVDDFAINRAVLKALLAKRGHRVIEAEDGVQAIAAVQLHQPQLVLMDVDMPLMDGLEATRRIRELDGACAGVPVYALTGKAFAEDVQRAREAGMHGHLSKPVQLKELVAVLRTVSAA